MAQTLENQLEGKLNKLRQTLRYWQTWEAEYEGFKEELEAEVPEPSAHRMVQIADEFGSSIIDESG
jgi:unconventional prefoldin RPB5 interactor 1